MRLNSTTPDLLPEHLLKKRGLFDLRDFNIEPPGVIAYLTKQQYQASSHDICTYAALTTYQFPTFRGSGSLV